MGLYDTLERKHYVNTRNPSSRLAAHGNPVLDRKPKLDYICLQLVWRKFRYVFGWFDARTQQSNGGVCAAQDLVLADAAVYLLEQQSIV